MTIELISYLIITLGAVQGIVLSFYLLISNRGITVANRLLGLILLFFSLNMIIPGLLHYFFEEFPHLFAAGFPLMFLFGPGIYFYTLILTKKRDGYFRQDLLHLIPFIISLALTVPLYLESAETKVAILREWHSGNLSDEILAGWALECLHLTIYLVLSVITLRQYSKASPDKINLDWLKHLVMAKSAVWAIYFVLFLLFLFGLNGGFFNYIFFVFALSVSTLTYSIGYKALRQPRLFGTDKNGLGKYKKSGMSSSMIAIYKRDLIRLMESKQPYLEPDLKLSDLAELLQMPSNYLSQVINESFEQNFFDFVNSYRIEMAKNLLSDPVSIGLSIMEVAYRSGFNSKSTFNTAFKKFTKLTPSEYRDGNNERASLIVSAHSSN